MSVGSAESQETLLTPEVGGWRRAGGWVWGGHARVAEGAGWVGGRGLLAWGCPPACPHCLPLPAGCLHSPSPPLTRGAMPRRAAARTRVTPREQIAASKMRDEARAIDEEEARASAANAASYMRAGANHVVARRVAGGGRERECATSVSWRRARTLCAAW